MEINSFNISMRERLQSKRNQLFFKIRKQFAFTRKGYCESGEEVEIQTWEKSFGPKIESEIQFLKTNYDFQNLQNKLTLCSWKKNLSTLWILHQFPDLVSKLGSDPISIIEAGAHDFQRAPALQKFFSSYHIKSQLLGLELDAYRILSDFHSRFDRAKYFSELAPNSQYHAGDFFKFQSTPPADILFTFYPFVSPHPAIAWGLPLEFGNAKLWIEALARNLRSQGLAFVLHQGNWEEEEFQECLDQNPGKFRLLERKTLECLFYPLPYPMQASLYERASS